MFVYGILWGSAVTYVLSESWNVNVFQDSLYNDEQSWIDRTRFKGDPCLKAFILGLVIGTLILPMCGYMYFRFGYAPVATSASPMPFEKKMASMAIRARIRAEAPKKVPVQPDEPNLTLGAKVYVANCAFCHGLPNQPTNAAAKGMFPEPPQLFRPDDMVTDDPVGTIYWKVDNGIRMTGMPGFSKSLSDAQVWQVSLMLSRADKLPDQTKAILTAPAAAQ
jgi:mono/diheme cytochrome c family protein